MVTSSGSITAESVRLCLRVDLSMINMRQWQCLLPWYGRRHEASVSQAPECIRYRQVLTSMPCLHVLPCTSSNADVTSKAGPPCTPVSHHSLLHQCTSVPVYNCRMVTLGSWSGLKAREQRAQSKQT